MGKLYDEKSIESLSPLEFTRLRPQVYCGDTSYSTQLLIEIFSNAIDEFRLGHGSQINIYVKHDKEETLCEVRDYGQGFIPNLFREDGKTVLEAAFSVLNTSGKYREDGTYEGTSLGSFGIGSKLPVFLSHHATITTFRNKQIEKIYFNEGVFVKRETKDINSNETGTLVSWIPSEEFFTNTDIDFNSFVKLCETTACLCPGLTINLKYENNEKTNNQTFYSKNGLKDLLLKSISNNKELLKHRFELKYNKDKYSIDLILTYIDSYFPTFISYVNTGLTETGPHITQLKTTLTRELNKFFKAKNWLKEKDTNLTGEDLQEGLYLICNITAPNVAYDAQIKTRVTKIDTKILMQAFSENLQNWLATNEKEIKIIADKALNARKAREAAKKAKENARKPVSIKTKDLKTKMQLSTKFIDCTNKDPKNRNLLIVEGLSAGSAAIEARNAATDCIYMLRGKIISPLKTTLDKLLANQEISDIITVIGAGFNQNFDVSKMNFDKIVITTDADSDGADIELLLITFFYTYMQPLIETGKLYRAVTPLYILKKKNRDDIYLYTEEEMDSWKKKGISGYEVLRAKGLGELNAADLHKVCFEKQRFKRITISDIEKTTQLLNILEGKDVAPRKQYIYNNAERLGFEFD